MRPRSRRRTAGTSEMPIRSSTRANGGVDAGRDRTLDAAVRAPASCEGAAARARSRPDERQGCGAQRVGKKRLKRAAQRESTREGAPGQQCSRRIQRPARWERTRRAFLDDVGVRFHEAAVMEARTGTSFSPLAREAEIEV